MRRRLRGGGQGRTEAERHDHGNGEFSRLGHLKSGSVKVKTGQRVKAGDQIGEMGSSGSSLFPHLHYELATGPDMKAEGLPSTFRNLDRLLGAKRAGASRQAIVCMARSFMSRPSRRRTGGCTVSTAHQRHGLDGHHGVATLVDHLVEGTHQASIGLLYFTFELQSATPEK